MLTPSAPIYLSPFLAHSLYFLGLLFTYSFTIILTHIFFRSHTSPSNPLEPSFHRPSTPKGSSFLLTLLCQSPCRPLLSSHPSNLLQPLILPIFHMDLLPLQHLFPSWTRLWSYSIFHSVFWVMYWFTLFLLDNSRCSNIACVFP